MLCTVVGLCCVAKCFEVLSDSGHKAGVSMRLCMWSFRRLYAGHTASVCKAVIVSDGGLAAM